MYPTTNANNLIKNSEANKQNCLKGEDKKPPFDSPIPKDENEKTSKEQESDPVNTEEKMNQMNPMINGKDRIQPATDSQISDYNKNAKNDASTLKESSLMQVIANTTIAALQTVTNSTPLRTIPLSGYEFGNVDRKVTSGFGLSPFAIQENVPQLFNMKTLYNEAQQTNITDMAMTRFSAQGINETVQTSIKVFNISTMTVRIGLNENIGNGKILDPNSIADGAIKLQTVERTALVNPQASVNFVENRIFSLLSAYMALDNILVAIPSKITCLDTFSGGVVSSRLLSMPFYEGLAPHLYYSIFSNLPQWMKDYMDETFLDNPLRIGDNVVTSYHGKKLSQYNQLVIDQFTAGVLRLNFDKLRSSLLSTDMIQQKIRASLYTHDDVEVEMIADSEEFTLLYDYTPTEYNLLLFTILTNIDIKKEITDFALEEITKSNRLSRANIEDVWTPLIAADSNAAGFNTAWLMSINIGDSKSPYEMLIYETFSDFFDFELKFHSIPRGLEAITEVFNIYTFMILYPRITQRIVHRLGYRLTRLYNAMFRSIFSNFQAKFGDLRSEFGAAAVDMNSYPISMVESQSGYVYTVFTDLKQIPANKKFSSSKNASTLLNDFINIVNDLRELVLPTTKKIVLNEKRLANYPYLYDDYTTYPSWDAIAHDDYLKSQTSKLGDRLVKLLDFTYRFKSLFTAQDPDMNKMPGGFTAYFSTWSKQVSHLFGTVGAAFEVTSAMMQTSLFNSPLFVGSMYNPHPDRFFFVAQDIGIGPLSSAPLHSTIVPQRLKVPKFLINVGTAHALTLEGEYLRNTLNPTEEVSDMRGPNTRSKTDIGPLNGVAVFMKTNSLLASSRKYGYAMQITQWLTTPNDHDNPFGPLIEEIAQYMKMSTWVPLVRKVFDLFGLKFDSIFMSTIGVNAIVLDGRSLDRVLVIINPATSMAIEDPPMNSKFGRKFDYMVSFDISKLSILARPLLSMDSKIIHIHHDWYFGKMIVDEMSPTQTNLGITNWTDETTFNKDFIFSKVFYKVGQASQLQYRSDKDGTLKTIILPFTASNVPSLLIKVDHVRQLKQAYFPVLASAMAEGKIFLRIKHFKIRVTVNDIPSRTDDCSDKAMSKNEILDILHTTAGGILDRTFNNTLCAVNYNSSLLVQTGYFQWFATPNPADRNIFVSTITNAIERPPQTILPTSDELGFGPDPNGLTFKSGVLKTKSNLINWNNEIPTVSRSLINNIQITIIPSIPQYLGAH